MFILSIFTRGFKNFNIPKQGVGQKLKFTDTFITEYRVCCYIALICVLTLIIPILIITFDYEVVRF